MRANLDHWYPPATVRKNLKDDSWEYREGTNGMTVHSRGGKKTYRFFKRKSDAICFAEEQIAKNQISQLFVYNANGEIAYHKESRLWKEIKTAKKEAVHRYECELYDMRKKYAAIQEKADKWDKVSALFESI